jgi:hypothetical protein
MKNKLRREESRNEEANNKKEQEGTPVKRPGEKNKGPPLVPGAKHPRGAARPAPQLSQDRLPQQKVGAKPPAQRQQSRPGQPPNSNTGGRKPINNKADSTDTDSDSEDERPRKPVKGKGGPPGGGGSVKGKGGPQGGGCSLKGKPPPPQPGPGEAPNSPDMNNRLGYNGGFTTARALH